jgi:hypothetical protein
MSRYTRKDFDLVASILRAVRKEQMALRAKYNADNPDTDARIAAYILGMEHATRDVKGQFVEYFSHDNSRFDADKFNTECKP